MVANAKAKPTSTVVDGMSGVTVVIAAGSSATVEVVGGSVTVKASPISESEPEWTCVPAVVPEPSSVKPIDSSVDKKKHYVIWASKEDCLPVGIYFCVWAHIAADLPGKSLFGSSVKHKKFDSIETATAFWKTKHPEGAVPKYACVCSVHV